MPKVLGPGAGDVPSVAHVGAGVVPDQFVASHPDHRRRGLARGLVGDPLQVIGVPASGAVDLVAQLHAHVAVVAKVAGAAVAAVHDLAVGRAAAAVRRVADVAADVVFAVGDVAVADAAASHLSLGRRETGDGPIDVLGQACEDAAGRVVQGLCHGLRGDVWTCPEGTVKRGHVYSLGSTCVAGSAYDDAACDTEDLKKDNHEVNVEK